MKKLVLYHVLTLTPILLLLSLYSYRAINTIWFAVLFFIYAFVYRPIVDFQRLRQKRLMRKDEFWKIFGLRRFKYYYTLLFEV